MKRRTGAVVEFVVGVCSLAAMERLRRRTTDDRPEWTSPWVVAGALAAVAYGWANDTDWRSIRTNRRRRLAFSFGRFLTRSAVFRGRDRSNREFGLGELAGMLLYRLRYGVLGPVPGTAE